MGYTAEVVGFHVCQWGGVDVATDVVLFNPGLGHIVEPIASFELRPKIGEKLPIHWEPPTAGASFALTPKGRWRVVKKTPAPSI